MCGLTKLPQNVTRGMPSWPRPGVIYGFACKIRIPMVPEDRPNCCTIAWPVNRVYSHVFPRSPWWAGFDQQRSGVRITFYWAFCSENPSTFQHHLFWLQNIELLHFAIAKNLQFVGHSACRCPLPAQPTNSPSSLATTRTPQGARHTSSIDWEPGYIAFECNWKQTSGHLKWWVRRGYFINLHSGKRCPFSRGLPTTNPNHVPKSRSWFW